MKNVIISGLIVASLAAGVCIFSIRTMEETCGRMNEMSVQMQRMYEAGERTQAAACAEQMISYWQSRRGMLKCLLNHEAVGEIDGVLLQAGADLAADEREALAQDVLLLGRLLHRLEREERLLLSNIL